MKILEISQWLSIVRSGKHALHRRQLIEASRQNFDVQFHALHWNMSNSKAQTSGNDVERIGAGRRSILTKSSFSSSDSSVGFLLRRFDSLRVCLIAMQKKFSF